MVEQTVAIENVFFKPMQFLYDLIHNNIQDVNFSRRTSTNLKDHQWIFPEIPEANDELYPRIALIPGNITFEEYGAGRFIETVTDENDDWISETRGVIAVLPITIGIFVKKKQVHAVELLDNSVQDMQNKKLSDYMGYQLVQLMISKRNNFISQNMEPFDVTSSESYEDGQFWYAKEVNLVLKMWMASSELFNPDDLIRHINLTIEIEGAFIGQLGLLTGLISHFGYP